MFRLENEKKEKREKERQEYLTLHPKPKPLCPNCENELTKPYECDLCGWTKERPKAKPKAKPYPYQWKYCRECKGKLSPPYSNCDFCGWQLNPPKEKPEEGKKRSRRIPQRIKNEVWRRDNGKCADCGSRINLEYDHIIPFSKGGSNTARNIELLCEKCNRKKYNKI